MRDADAPLAPAPAEEVTVSTVLSLPDLTAGDPEVLTGAEHLHAPVRWLHIAGSEDVGAVLEGGELVLSAGTALRSSEHYARAFLDQLEDAGAVAAVIELVDGAGERDLAALEVVGRASAGRSMPVVVLHRQVRFVRITQAAHQLLIGRELARVERLRQVHEVFTELSLEAADEHRIVEVAGTLLGGPVVLEDAAHRVLAFRAGQEGAGALLEDWAERARADGQWLRTPVGVQGRHWGRLVAPLAVAGDAATAQILERAAQAVTLARMVSQDRRDLLQQARSGFVHELMGPHGMTEQEAHTRLGSLGLAAAPRWMPLVVHLIPVADEDPTALQLRERAVLDSLVAAGGEAAPAVLAGGMRPGAFAALLGVGTAAEPDLVLTAVLERTAELLGEDVTAPRWVVGAGAVAEPLLEAGRRLDGAAQVASIVETMEVRPRPFHRFADVRLRGVLALRTEDPGLRAFAEAELGPLLRGEERAALELLSRYLESGGNITALSRTMHLSRPALYARLARLEERLGVSLQDAESRTSLHTALLWLQVGGGLRGTRGSPGVRPAAPSRSRRADR